MNQPNHTPVEPQRHIVRDNNVPAAVGRMVDYVLSQSDSPTSYGRVRPAVIVELVEDGSRDGLVALQVFTNGGYDQLPNVHHVRAAVHVEDVPHPNGSWHWPPPRELVFKDVPVQVMGPPDEEDENAPTEIDSEPAPGLILPPSDAVLNDEAARLEAHIASKGYAVVEAPVLGAPLPPPTQPESVAAAPDGLPFSEGKPTP